MKINMSFRNPLIIILSISVIMTSCLTAKKVDAYIANQYGNQFPKQDKKKDSVISMTSTVTAASPEISTTVIKTSKMLSKVLTKESHYIVTSLNWFIRNRRITYHLLEINFYGSGKSCHWNIRWKIFERILH